MWETLHVCLSACQEGPTLCGLHANAETAVIALQDVPRERVAQPLVNPSQNEPAINKSRDQCVERLIDARPLRVLSIIIGNATATNVSTMCLRRPT